MSKGGLIVRLIDVVLNILFGFLVISDFSLKAQIKLSSSGQDTNPEREKIILLIKITPEEKYYVEEGNQITIFDNQGLLENYLVTKHQQCQNDQQEMVVVLEPHPNTIIQATVDVLDICEKHQIPRNIAYTN